jgi:phage N-6-adenine-methyltransferase
VSTLPFMPKSDDRDNWFTPDDLFREIETRYGPFDIDVAASDKNAKCDRFYTADDDALTQHWDGAAFCNPPYRDLIRWVKKAHDEVRSGRCKRAVLLLPAQTSTAWFHDYALRYGHVWFIRGKRKFGNAKGTAMSASIVVVFWPQSA